MIVTNKCPYRLIPLAVIFSVVVICYALLSTWLLASEDAQRNKNKGPSAVDTLKLVIVVSRHGNRRYVTIPNDPYPLNDTKLWPYGLGELTTAGRVQMYNLGVKIRALYNGFLNTTYYSDDFYASSTKIDRVIQSGEVFLAGLYPPTGFQIWNKNIRWQPIPLYTDSLDKTVAMTETICPKYEAERALSVGQFIADKDNALSLAPIVDYLKTFIGLNDTSYFSLFAAWDTFISEEIEGYTLPAWTRKVYPEPMKDLISKLYIEMFSSTDTMARLILGSFFREIIHVMERKANKTLSPDRKMYFYSGHDTSLIVLQYMLGIPKSSIIGMVNPGSAIFYELHQDPNDKRFYVQVLYIDGNSPDLKPIVLKVPDYDILLDFEHFLIKTQKFYNITDYESECQLNFTENKVVF